MWVGFNVKTTLCTHKSHEHTRHPRRTRRQTGSFFPALFSRFCLSIEIGIFYNCRLHSTHAPTSWRSAAAADILILILFLVGVVVVVIVVIVIILMIVVIMGDMVAVMGVIVKVVSERRSANSEKALSGKWTLAVKSAILKDSLKWLRPGLALAGGRRSREGGGGGWEMRMCLMKIVAIGWIELILVALKSLMMMMIIMMI